MLDTLAVAAIATLLAWPALGSGWGTTRAAAQLLSERTSQRLMDRMLDGSQLPSLVPALLHDPGLLQAAQALRSGLWTMAAPWLASYLLLALAWHVAGELSPWQGSPGKHAMGLQVTDLHGRRLPWPRVLVRHVAGLLSWLTFNFGHALALLPPERRSLHDRIAGAQVVDR